MVEGADTSLLEETAEKIDADVACFLCGKVLKYSLLERFKCDLELFQFYY